MNELGLKLVELLNSGTDLLSSELPAFVGELLLYKTVAYSIGLIIGIVILAIAYGGFRKWRYYQDDDCPDYHDGKEDIAIGKMIIGSIVGTMVFMVEALNLLQITIAPKVWLLEYAKDLMN